MYITQNLIEIEKETNIKDEKHDKFEKNNQRFFLFVISMFHLSHCKFNSKMSLLNKVTIKFHVKWVYL